MSQINKSCDTWQIRIDGHAWLTKGGDQPWQTKIGSHRVVVVKMPELNRWKVSCHDLGLADHIFFTPHDYAAIALRRALAEVLNYVTRAQQAFTYVVKGGE